MGRANRHFLLARSGTSFNLNSSHFQTFKSFNRYASFKTLMKMTSWESPEKSGCADRRRYLHRVCEVKKRFGLSVLNCRVTSNHIHLLVRDTGGQVIAQSMQLINCGTHSGSVALSLDNPGRDKLLWPRR